MKVYKATFLLIESDFFRRPASVVPSLWERNPLPPYSGSFPLVG